MKGMRSLKKYQKIIFILLGIAFIFFLWWLFAYLANSGVLPGPTATFNALGPLFSNPFFYTSLGYTLLRVILTLLICFILGGLFGTLSALFKPLGAFLYPLISVLRVYPTIIFLVIIVILVNDRLSPYIISSLVLFPIIYQAFYEGIDNIDENIIKSLKIEGNIRHPRSVFKVLLPLSFPYIALSITQTVGLGLKVTMMAELMGASNTLPGLGNLIKVYQQDANYAGIYAIAIVAIMLTIIIDVGLYFLKKYIAKKYALKQN